ncbi:hypothetical protein LTS18_006935 [Coniosporium uncinatum]|uniref:Uncharacterized protein n=1 Tax=Coniosporium uncinatum TaxID=93489 RepID=A0ACC3DPX9_9PEZI|nr:hypothetical protein LTS18_006935 [Coniosporium uncinatum]
MAKSKHFQSIKAKSGSDQDIWWIGKCLRCSKQNHNNWYTCLKKCFHCDGVGAHVGRICPHSAEAGKGAKWWIKRSGGLTGDQLQHINLVLEQQAAPVAEPSDFQAQLAQLQQQVDKLKRELSQQRDGAWMFAIQPVPQASSHQRPLHAQPKTSPPQASSNTYMSRQLQLLHSRSQTRYVDVQTVSRTSMTGNHYALSTATTRALPLGISQPRIIELPDSASDPRPRTSAARTSRDDAQLQLWAGAARMSRKGEQLGNWTETSHWILAFSALSNAAAISDVMEVYAGTRVLEIRM